MKKAVLVISMLCAATLVQAQVSERANWYDGQLCFSARNIAGGKVEMKAMAEGEELGFILVPVSGKKDTYHVVDTPDELVNQYSEIATVRHRKGDKLDVLCFYDAAGKLQGVMSNEGDEWNSEALSRRRWISQIAGEYFFNEVEGETRITITDKADEDGRYRMSVDGVMTTINIVTFNGLIIGFIRVGEMGGTPMMGTWEVIPTLDGLTLREFEDDPDQYFFDWKPTGMEYFLTKVNNGSGQYRFEFARTTLLNDRMFRKMDKETLRVMRNYILARHGYKFTSQDLLEYFSREAWYSPRESNDGIAGELTLLERLNIELIQAAE